MLLLVVVYALVLVSGVVGAAVQSFSPSFAAVNWSLVAAVDTSASKAAPLGCACVGGDRCVMIPEYMLCTPRLTRTPSSACVFFECRCACDLTAGACDPFCCCDRECTAAQVDSARDQGLCGSEDAETLDTSVEYCATDLAFGKTRASASALVAESVLCVAVDNNEVAGEYFASAPETQMTVASAFRTNPKPLSFASAYRSRDLDLLTSPPTKSTYSPGDVIRTFAVAADTRPVRASVLSGFGAAVGSNECRELNLVRFEFTQKITTCTRVAVALETACSDTAGFLSAAPFAHNILVAKRPNVTSEGATSDVLSIEVEVNEFDFVTGASTVLTSPLPSYFPTPELAKNRSVCYGALLGLEYVVLHDALGGLERIRAKVTVGNVSAVAPASSVDITQSFGVSFQSQSSLPAGIVSLANGNVQEHERSGNPGYLLHYPVRVGVVVSKTAQSGVVSVVSEMIGGLQIPGLGECSSRDLVSQTIAFGEDSQTSCSLTLTADEFKALCSRSEPLLAPLRVNFTRVAMFGNSDPLLASEWLVLDYDAPTKSTAVLQDAVAPGSIELTCQDAITSVNLEFLVAQVGPTTSPQLKIIAARAFHAKETWTFWRSGANKQTFLVRTTVNFVFVAATPLEQLIPPSPPIWFSIPSDVFYPFILNDAPRARPAWGLLSLVWIAVALVHL